MTTEQLVPEQTHATAANVLASRLADGLANGLANSIPAEWLADLEKKLANGENVLTGVEVDLDSRLRFKKGIIVLTGHRLLACAPGETAWQEWPFRAGLRLQHHDHAGVGHLELLDEQGRLASWRF